MTWEIVTLEQPVKNDHYLAKAHERAAKKAGAVIGNFAWVWGEDSIISKTNKGKLQTFWPTHKGGRYIHKWYDTF